MPILTPTRSQSPTSSFCFGTMQYGGNADHAASHAMYETCRAAGINFFDTAHVYTDGLSETFLGEFVAAERDHVLIATKVGFVGGCDRNNLMQQFDVSQKRLNMDYVDILYLHRFDLDCSLQETIETIVQLQNDGKVRQIGVSNYSAWQVMKAQRIAEQLGSRIDIIQPMYNLVKRQVEVEILPMCASEGIAVVPYSPLGGGLLTGKYLSGETGRLIQDDGYKLRYGVEWMHKTAEAIRDLSAEYGVSAATLAVAWVTYNSTVSAPIISARNVVQLKPSLDAIHYHLPPELYARLSRLSPTPAPATDRLEEIQ
ncbi:MAG: aldo/keto reductase [Pseudoruegeria sp.]